MGARSRQKGAAFERELARVQAEVGARPPIYLALQEAEDAAGPGRHPVALIRRNGRGSTPPTDLAVLPLDDFLEMVALLRSCGAW